MPLVMSLREMLQQHNRIFIICVGPLMTCYFHIPANNFVKCAFQAKRVIVTLKTNKHPLNGQNGHHTHTQKSPTSQ